MSLEQIRYNPAVALQYARGISGNEELQVYETARNPGEGNLFWPCVQCKAAYIVVPAETLLPTEEDGVVKCSCSKCAVATEQLFSIVLIYNLALGHEGVSPAVVRAALAQ